MSDSGSDIKCSNVEGCDGASSDAGGYGVGGSDGECVDIGGYDADGSEAEGSNTESSTSNLQTFELFPRLPIEIRYMIWHVTFPSPQRHVWCDLDGACCKLLGIFRHPIALYINRESGTEALRSYEKLEEGQQRCRHYKRRTTFVFFNKESDTFRMKDMVLLNNADACFWNNFGGGGYKDREKDFHTMIFG